MTKKQRKDEVIKVLNKKVYTKQKNVAITTLSLYATLTDILIDDRLAFNVEEDGTISGVSWYSECKK
jgi:hypothetical protein